MFDATLSGRNVFSSIPVALPPAIDFVASGDIAGFAALGRYASACSALREVVDTGVRLSSYKTNREGNH